ncbi:MAG: putative Serine/threonine-protein kinase Nek3 [Streblomastix strix]|uniref:non-specific serine/threonine protein kinase n=1 Tax=Streblomastix strix TaxID=222440 RepID=A0A5J4WKJ2_9EUKA|nr:MAG: putative Serine/threonine-protein kinase Nek3 [Streblomastix strix]
MSKFEDYEVVKKLFGGAQGKTFLVKLKKSGVLYVMKRVDYFDDKDKQQADDEVAQMINLESRFTVRLVCTFLDHLDLCLILEYCSGGDLRKIVSDLQKLPQEERMNRVWELQAQIIRALHHLHSHGVVHRDIKPENIFVMEDGSVRLGDFGLARDLTDNYFATLVGTKIYLAPEIWILKRIDFSSDIFSVGIIIYELLIGDHPFNADNEQAMIEKIKKGERAQISDWIEQDLKEIVSAMLNSV